MNISKGDWGDILSFVIAIALVFAAGFVLRWLLVLVHVPVRWANAIAGVITLLAALYVFAFMKAMRNP